MPGDDLGPAIRDIKLDNNIKLTPGYDKVYKTKQEAVDAIKQMLTECLTNLE